MFLCSVADSACGSQPACKGTTIGSILRVLEAEVTQTESCGEITVRWTGRFVCAACGSRSCTVRADHKRVCGSIIWAGRHELWCCVSRKTKAWIVGSDCAVLCGFSTVKSKSFCGVGGETLGSDL